MSEQQTPFQPEPKNGNEIDPLIAMFKTMWIGRKTILLSVFAGTIFGVIVALLSPKEFVASTIMVPQLGSDNQTKMGGLGGLGGLAALAGINIDMNQGAELSPMIYPQIVSSIPFQLELMNAPLNFQDYQKPITLLDYYTKDIKPTIIGTLKKYTIGLPSLIAKGIKGKPREFSVRNDSTLYPMRLTDNQLKVQKALEQLVILDINSKEGYLTLTAQMPEPIAASQLAKKAQTLMQSYITEFKIEKAKANLNFIQARYNETKSEFEKAQVSLALVNDRNKNFTSGLPQVESDRLQTRYTIAFTVFQEMAKQLEQAKIQVKKETPIFTIIEPVTVPSEKSKPNRPLILFTWIFIGGVVGTIILFGRSYIFTIRRQWREF